MNDNESQKLLALKNALKSARKALNALTDTRDFLESEGLEFGLGLGAMYEAISKTFNTVQSLMCHVHANTPKRKPKTSQ